MQMTTHKYALEEIFAFTPEELDAYLATKARSAATLGEKRQVALQLLQAEGMLDFLAARALESDNFDFAIKQTPGLVQFRSITKIRLHQIFAATPEDLDAYLATKGWSATTLADKRQATLQFLQADGMLDYFASIIVRTPNFVAAIQQTPDLEHFVNMTAVPQRLREFEESSLTLSEKEGDAILKAAEVLSTYTGPYTRASVCKLFPRSACKVVFDTLVIDFRTY